MKTVILIQEILPMVEIASLEYGDELYMQYP